MPVVNLEGNRLSDLSKISSSQQVVVYRARGEDGRGYLVKVAKMSENGDDFATAQLQREIVIYQCLRGSQFIVELISSHYRRVENYFVLVFEYCGDRSARRFP